MVENDVFSANKIMNLFAKRSRSKAPLAAFLSHSRLVDLGSIASNLLRFPYHDAVSQGEGGWRERDDAREDGGME